MEHGDGVGPADAAVRDALPVGKVTAFDQLLCAGDEIAFDLTLGRNTALVGDFRRAAMR